MLADGGERLGDHVGACDELGLGLRDLVADALRHRFGTVGYAPLGLADMVADPGRHLLGAGGDALFRMLDVGHDRHGADTECVGRLVDPGADLLLDAFEDAPEFGCALGNGIGAAVDAGGEAAVCLLEDAPELVGALGDGAGWSARGCRRETARRLSASSKMRPSSTARPAIVLAEAAR